MRTAFSVVKLASSGESDTEHTVDENKPPPSLVFSEVMYEHGSFCEILSPWNGLFEIV